MKGLKNYLKELEFKFDYYFTIFLYNPNKVDRYTAYMAKKWGTRYTGTDGSGEDQG